MLYLKNIPPFSYANELLSKETLSFFIFFKKIIKLDAPIFAFVLFFRNLNNRHSKKPVPVLKTLYTFY